MAPDDATWPVCCERDYSNYTGLYAPDRCGYAGCTGEVAQFSLYESTMRYKVMRLCSAHAFDPSQLQVGVRIVERRDIEGMQMAGSPGVALVQARETGILCVANPNSPLISFWRTICLELKVPFIVRTSGRLLFGNDGVGRCSHPHHATALLDKLATDLQKLGVTVMSMRNSGVPSGWSSPSISLPGTAVDEEAIDLVVRCLRTVSDPDLFAVSLVLDI